MASCFVEIQHEVRIAEFDTKIAKKEQEIKELKTQRDELTKSHQAELATQVVKLTDEKGVSIEELLKKLEN